MNVHYKMKAKLLPDKHFTVDFVWGNNFIAEHTEVSIYKIPSPCVPFHPHILN